MADTYSCPTSDSKPGVLCLDESDPDIGLIYVYDLIDIITDRVNAFKSVMSESPIESIRRATDVNWPVIDCQVLGAGGTGPAGDFDGIADYVNNVLFASGYVYKQARYPDPDDPSQPGSLWPVPPSTAEDVQLLRSCGAFWSDWDEVYDCLKSPDDDQPLNKNLRKCTFDNCGTCADVPAITKNAWRDMVYSLECLANYKCYPECRCVICGEGGESCDPCNKCISIRVTYEGFYALASAAGYTDGHCAMVYSFSAPFRAADGYEVSGLSMTADLTLVKSYMSWTVAIDDNRSYTRVLTHQPVLSYIGTEGPSTLCEEVPENGQIDTVVEPVYWDNSGTTTPEGEITVELAIGTAICADPWNGTAPYYTISMGDIPVCEQCGTSVDPPFDGTVYKGANGYTPMQPLVSHLNHEFYAGITFDATRCAYILTISCGVGGTEVWRGINVDCGNPAGEYTLDPEFANPCFNATIHVST